MAEEKVEAAPVSIPAEPAGPGKLIIIITLVNMLVSLGMMGVLFVSFQRDRKQPTVADIAAHGDSHSAEGEAKEGAPAGGDAKDAAKKRASEFGKMVTLEQFTVNLSTPGSVNPKFVRVNISLEVPSDDAESEVAQKMPQVRNAIIDLFNSKRPTDLATAEGREYIKEEIRNALNGFMVSGKVKGVFFTNFAVSS